MNLFLYATNPTSPELRRSMVEGSGTGAYGRKTTSVVPLGVLITSRPPLKPPLPARMPVQMPERLF